MEFRFEEVWIFLLFFFAIFSIHFIVCRKLLRIVKEYYLWFNYMKISLQHYVIIGMGEKNIFMNVEFYWMLVIRWIANKLNIIDYYIFIMTDRIKKLKWNKLYPNSLFPRIWTWIHSLISYLRDYFLISLIHGTFSI